MLAFVWLVGLGVRRVWLLAWCMFAWLFACWLVIISVACVYGFSLTWCWWICYNIALFILLVDRCVLIMVDCLILINCLELWIDWCLCCAIWFCICLFMILLYCVVAVLGLLASDLNLICLHGNSVVSSFIDSWVTRVLLYFSECFVFRL